MEKRETILLIDDEKEVVNALKRTLGMKGYEILATTMPKEAISWIENERIDLIICDQQIPEMSGVDILAYSKKYQPEAIRILITGYADLNIAVAAINEGKIYHYISKPWNNAELNRIVREGLDKKRKQKQDAAKAQSDDHRAGKESYNAKIPVWDKDDILVMRTAEVTFISAVNGEVIIHTVNGDFKSNETLSYWETRLKGQHFLRCHRSYVVNIERIEKISPWFHGAFNLKLKDAKESIPVSRNSVKSLKEHLDL